MSTGKKPVARRATRGSRCGPPARTPLRRVASEVGLGSSGTVGRSAIRISIRKRRHRPPRLVWGTRPLPRQLGNAGNAAGVSRIGSDGVRGRLGPVGTGFFHPLVVERLEDAGPDALLELEEDADAGQVDAPVTGEVTDPEDPSDVLFAVEPDVRVRPSRADETLVLVDPERPRMDAHDARGDADHV